MIKELGLSSACHLSMRKDEYETPLSGVSGRDVQTMFQMGTPPCTHSACFHKSSIFNFQVNYHVKQSDYILYIKERRKEIIQTLRFNLD